MKLAKQVQKIEGVLLNFKRNEFQKRKNTIDIKELK